MLFKFTANLLAMLLATALAPGFAQDQQPSKSQASANTPQNSAPQAGPQAPPSNDAQSAAPSQTQQDQATRKPGEPTSDQNTPTQEQAPPQTGAQPPQRAAPETNNPAKPKPTTHKATQNRKRKARTTAQSKSTRRAKAGIPSSGEPGKVVVRNGGAMDDVVHLSPGGPQEQNAHNRENTAQLLATTDENLKMLASRQLSPTEQSTVDQIHAYMRQAKSAADSGDLARAHTLAFKAHLLSDDLAKH